MDDLISREALRDVYFKKCNGECCTCVERDDESGDCGLIRYAPSVDAVPVVRCKDCVYRGNEIYCPMFRMEETWDEDDGADYYYVDLTVDDGFCYCGAKMDLEVSGDV